MRHEAHFCAGCGRRMSEREWNEQRLCNDCFLRIGDYTVEYRPQIHKWEVQHLGGHVGLYDYAEQAVKEIHSLQEGARG